MEVQTFEIEKLKHAKYNPRKDLQPTDEEYIKLKNSIIEFGYIDPIIINKNYVVIGGHQRLKVLRDLGFKKIDCIVVDVDSKKEKALNIALNKIDGKWDDEKLYDILKDSSKEDITLTGFNENYVLNIMKNINKETSVDSSIENNEEDNLIQCPKCKSFFKLED